MPTTTLSAELNQRIVCAVEDGGMHPQPVETGGSYGDDTAVTDGLKPGMRIAAIRKRHAGIKVVAAAPAKGDAPAPDQASR